MSKADLEAANWRIVRAWAAGLGLEYAGVDLADGAAYALLTILGRIQLEALEGGENGE